MRSQRQEFFAKRKNRLITRLGTKYANCTIANFQLSNDAKIADKQKAVISKLRLFEETLPGNVRQGVNFVLYGAVGTGKDHFLAAMLLMACDEGFSIQWHDGASLASELREIAGGEDSNVVDEMIRADILAISDPLPPGSSLTAFVREKLFMVIDRRTRDEKPTWITMNIASQKEADERFGAPLIDRLLDGALSIGCDWPSFRTTRRWGNEK